MSTNSTSAACQHKIKSVQSNTPPTSTENSTVDPRLIARSGTQVERSRRDLFSIPILGSLIKSRHVLFCLRTIILALSAFAVIFGFIVPDADHNHITNGFFWGLFWPFFMLISVATFGPLICSFCPHGFVGSYLTKWGLKKKIPKTLQTPYIGLGVILLAYWGLHYAFNPYQSPVNTAWFFTILSAIAVISFLLFKDMAYCHSLCPLGSVRAAFGKLGFAWLSTYNKACTGCKSFDCAKVCDYKLSPFNFDRNGSMDNCTLCMKCAQACPSVRWQINKPSYSLLSTIKRTRNIDIWVYILLLAVITITMRFHHGLGRSAIAEFFPWSITASWLDQTFPQFNAIGLDTTGVVALTFALLLTLSVTLGGFYISSKILGISYQKVFNTLGYALAPLMAIGGLGHAGEFFFLSYYSEMANATNQLLGLSDQLVEPLANRGASWLHSFKLFQYLAVIWSYYLFYKRLQLIEVETWRKWVCFPSLSAMTTLYIGLIFYTSYVFATYGAAVHQH